MSSDVKENTIVPQLLSEIDGVEQLKNVIVIGAPASRGYDRPGDPAAGRLDVKIKIERPIAADAARDIFSKYLLASLPLADEVVTSTGGDREAALTPDHRRGTQPHARRRREPLPRGHLHQQRQGRSSTPDFNSGAMIENIVNRAKEDGHQAVPGDRREGHQGESGPVHRRDR